MIRSVAFAVESPVPSLDHGATLRAANGFHNLSFAALTTSAARRRPRVYSIVQAPPE
jgi:hypothetical protein